MRILLLSSCTKSKAISCKGQLTLADFQAGAGVVAARERGLPRLKAEAMYTGRQHALLQEGIGTLRAARPAWTLEWSIVSAGYGLVPSSRLLAPYQATFSQMPMAAAYAWARVLLLPERLREVLAGTFDVGIVVLGERYRAVGGLDEISSAGGALFVLGDRRGATGGDAPLVRRLDLGADAPRRFGAPWSAVRGSAARLLLRWLARDGERALEVIFAAGEIELAQTLPRSTHDP